MQSQRPYTLVARFYDELHGDAQRMNRSARNKVLGKILPSVHSVCDLGCGTGTTALELARRGLKMYAVDLSPTMCRLARQKAHRAGLPVRVICSDMRAFRLPEPVDLVICEFNPLNHLSRRADLIRVARSVWRALQPGGYFYFDLNTRRSLQELYPSAHWFEKRSFCMVCSTVAMIAGAGKAGWISNGFCLQEDSGGVTTNTWRMSGGLTRKFAAPCVANTSSKRCGQPRPARSRKDR